MSSKSTRRAGDYFLVPPGCDEVIPPNAPLDSSSKIAPESRGKVPGHKLTNGKWAGYDWRTRAATLVEIPQWERDGANEARLATAMAKRYGTVAAQSETPAADVA